MARPTMGLIESLREDEIFVFGSNLSGVHGGGAARQAYWKFGAIWGRGIGLQGQSYAIPTKDHDIRTLPLHEIQQYISTFVLEAKERKDLQFLVTEIGCGLAGYKVRDIAPMFSGAIEVENIHLPLSFANNLCLFC